MAVRPFILLYNAVRYPVGIIVEETIGNTFVLYCYRDFVSIGAGSFPETGGYGLLDFFFFEFDEIIAGLYKIACVPFLLFKQSKIQQLFLIHS